MQRTDLKRLNDADQLIREIATDLGLEFMPQEFDVVPAQKMLEIMAYRLPVNFSHWSFGRDYEIERTKHEHGYAVPYEVVFNSDPCRAYLMDTNPFPIQVLVMAHVYAHNDFMKNNRHFQNSRRDMITTAATAAERFRGYEEHYGIDAVERVIDAGMAIQWNIDPTEHIHRQSEDEVRQRLYGWSRELAPSGPYDDLIPDRPKPTRNQKRALQKRTPPEPTPDLLGYIINHSPRPLEEWEKDLLSVIKSQAQYFLPYRQTKIMNEGWATYWHEQIMQRLFQKRFLTAEEHGYYNLYNARVKAHHPRNLNPYLFGYAILKDLEDRWNKGRFGPEFEELTDAYTRDQWDTGLGKGREKLFEVRRTHMDWFFVDEFLSREVVENLDLYLYLEREHPSYYEVVVAETEWQKVKRILVQSLMNSGVPRILVTDGNYRNSLQLYLEHAYEGLPLQDEYARKTLELIHYLWDRPVYLETNEPYNDKTRGKLYAVDESGVHVRTE